MLKISSVLMAVCIFLVCILTCSVNVVSAVGAAEAVGGVVLNVAIDKILDFFTSSVSTANATQATKIEACRYYYFYKLLHNDYNYSGNLISDNGFQFSREYLRHTFDYYWKSVNESHLNEYDSNGDIYVQAAGFSDHWNLHGISFTYFLALYETVFADYSNYFNTLLARYALSEGSTTISDPNPGKSGLDIAPGYASLSDIQTDMYKANNLFTVKNADYKVSYRNDSRFQGYASVNPTMPYNNLPLYENFKFVSTNSDEAYISFFCNRGSTSLLNCRFSHFYFESEDHWYEDRDEIEYTTYTLNVDIIDLKSPTSEYGSTWDNAKHYSFDVSNYPYGSFLPYSSGTCYVYCYRDFYSYSTFALNVFHSLNLGSSISKGNFYPMSSSFISFYDLLPHFTNTYANHDKSCAYNGNCDLGYYAATHELSTIYDIDFSQIPEDYVIQVNGGDTIYNYNITNPSTGQTSTLNEYITNNYTYVEQGGDSGGGSEGGGSGGSISGDVNVHGDVGVNGEIDVNVDVNVNQGGTSIKPGDVITGDVDLGTYYDQAVEQTNGLNQFLAEFFSFLPNDILMLLGLTVAVAFICRLLGR